MVAPIPAFWGPRERTPRPPFRGSGPRSEAEIPTFQDIPEKTPPPNVLREERISLRAKVPQVRAAQSPPCRGSHQEGLSQTPQSEQGYYPTGKLSPTPPRRKSLRLRCTCAPLRILGGPVGQPRADPTTCFCSASQSLCGHSLPSHQALPAASLRPKLLGRCSPALVPSSRSFNGCWKPEFPRSTSCPSSPAAPSLAPV